MKPLGGTVGSVWILKQAPLAARGKSRSGAKNGDCHQFDPRHGPRKKALSLKRIGWLYPIFRIDHSFLRPAGAGSCLAFPPGFRPNGSTLGYYPAPPWG